MKIKTINPTTGKIIKSYKTMGYPEIMGILNNGHLAYLSWKMTTFEQRSSLLLQLSDILKQKIEEFATLITQEMGKPIRAARNELEKCIWYCQHFAESAAGYLQPKLINTGIKKSLVTYEPTGIIFAIMPWNFPFLQVFRFAIPSLMLGNACLLKHAPITTGCGLAIKKIFSEAGFPEDIFHTCIIDTALTEKIIAHSHITGVTFTGSVSTGKIVAEQAARHLKKIVLELGGSDPYLILHDADLKLAAEKTVLSRLSNAGQVCVAAKRIIVVDSVRKEFETRVIEEVKKYQYTPTPDNDSTLILGPLARSDLRTLVHNQVLECINKGAELLVGGKIPPGQGYYYPATVLKNITPGMPAYDTEIFGPVIAFISAKDEEEAIKIANDTPYGLGAVVFTKDLERGEAVAKKINAGNCFVNNIVASDPRLPFGGTKNSGFGRELAEEGMREFANIKTICIYE